MELALAGVSKTYPNGVRALDDVTLTIPRGMFGLLGPNGAGKSTLMRSIATLQQIDAGSMKFGDIDIVRAPDQLREVLGYLPQDFGVYPKVSAIDMLDHLAQLKGMSDRKLRGEVVRALLGKVNLWQFRDRRLGGYSGGMKQRFGIAQALLGNPKLIIVDEPTAGLDPVERARFHDLLSEVSEDVVVLLSTHIVSDVEATAAHIALIHDGRLVAHGAPEELLARVEGRVWELAVRAEHLDDARRFWRVGAALRRGPDVLLRVVADEIPRPDAKAVAPTLEDAYLALVRDERGEPAGARP